MLSIAVKVHNVVKIMSHQHSEYQDGKPDLRSSSVIELSGPGCFSLVPTYYSSVPRGAQLHNAELVLVYTATHTSTVFIQCVYTYIFVADPDGVATFVCVEV